MSKIPEPILKSNPDNNKTPLKKKLKRFFKKKKKMAEPATNKNDEGDHEFRF